MVAAEIGKGRRQRGGQVGGGRVEVGAGDQDEEIRFGGFDVGVGASAGVGG